MPFTLPRLSSPVGIIAIVVSGTHFRETILDMAEEVLAFCQ